MPTEITIHSLLNDGREPTLQDLMYAFGVLEGKIASVGTNVNAMFRSILEREDNMDARLRVLEQKMGKVETRLEDIQDDLTSALAAFDRDSVTIVNQGHRITNLEMVIAA